MYEGVVGRGHCEIFVYGDVDLCEGFYFFGLLVLTH